MRGLDFKEAFFKFSKENWKNCIGGDGFVVEVKETPRFLKPKG